MGSSAIGQAIKLLRDERDITQAALAAKLGLTQSSLSAWERGEVNIKPPERRRLAEAFGMSLEEFDDVWRASRVERTRGGEGIPVINRAPAGVIHDYEEHGVDSGQGFEYLDWGDIHDDLAFAVVVVGNSMEPALFEGDYVIFTPMTTPKPRAVLDNGKIVFVRFTPESGKQGCTLARYYRQRDGTVVLRKDNHAHAPILTLATEIEQISVAIEKRSKRL